ncbi:MAG: alpha/beta hydrolase [Rubrivivax sp.]|nr:alpha/beta hydrolase [Rubrivivax sp.]
MHVLVNGVRLFFDVEGAGQVPSGARMRERPTVVLLHGGPGADHSHYRPQMSPLADVAQLVFYDHRGNGRSESGPQDRWTLAQWGDDVRGLCDALGIEKPIVLGASFGGMVALSYATRHPGHAGKLVLMNTAARGGAFTQRRVELFEQLGGPAAGALARRRLIDGDTCREVLDDWLRICVPQYNRSADDPKALLRSVRNAEATRWFSRAEGEGNHFDLRPALHRIRCPVLLMGGTLDPMLPVENQRDIAALLPPHLLRYEEFEGAGHGLLADAPERALSLLREFIALEISA